MKLTRSERWILSNQYQLLEMLDPQRQDECEQARTILERGYELLYDHIAPVYAETFSEADAREVLDILDMYRDLTFSFQKLDDKDGLTEQDVAFPGFDGNNEGKQLSFANFFCSMDGGRYTELGEIPNSHSPSLDIYRRMHSAWQSTRRDDAIVRNPLSAADIRQILDAARYRG